MSNYIVLDGHKAVFNIDQTQFGFLRAIKDIEAQIIAVETAKESYTTERQKLEKALDEFGSSISDVLDGIRNAIPELIK